MARIAGVDIPNEKRVEIGLTYIYGIGRKTSNDILTGYRHQSGYPCERSDGKRGCRTA